MLVDLPHGVGQGFRLRQMKLGDIYKRISEQEEKQQLAEESVITYDEVFQIFIAAALVLLVVMIMMPHTLYRPLNRSIVAAVMLLACLIQTSQAAELSVADSAFQNGEYQQALEVYDTLSRASDSADPVPDVLRDADAVAACCPGSGW